MPEENRSIRRATFAISLALSGIASAACCYFAALGKDVNQPGRRAFISWDEKQQTEAFTVQPQFEGNADDFGMVWNTQWSKQESQVEELAEKPKSGKWVKLANLDLALLGGRSRTLSPLSERDEIERGAWCPSSGFGSTARTEQAAQNLGIGLYPWIMPSRSCRGIRLIA